MASSKPQTSSQINFDQPWRKIASAPSGGTVTGLAAAGDGRLWLTSPAGLYRYNGPGWTPVIAGLPFQDVNAIHAVSRTLFVAGLPVGIAYTTDDGQRWYAGRSDQTRQPVTCFATSPHFTRDGVVLAGTHGEGVLRSNDGGRYWNLSNFGLRHFEVFALLSVGDWEAHERLFAATDGGVYESPNGGRAWRPAGGDLQGRTVLCLALLPGQGEDFEVHGTLLAGTEQAGLFRSTDGGRTWTPVPLGCEPGPINSLCVGPQGTILVGSGAAGLLRSTDAGRTWQPVGPQGAAALSLAAVENALYAGLHEDGLLISFDDGRTWQADTGLQARRYNLLAQAQPGNWLAGGATAGLWQLSQGETTWQPVDEWPPERPLYALAPCADGLLAAGLEGVWRGQADGTGWELALPVDSGIQLLAAHGERAWAGHLTGGLYRTEDGGASWQALPPAFDGQALVGLVVSPEYETDRILLAATAWPARQELQFWRSRDGGQTWATWFKEHTRWYAVRLAPAGERAAETSFGFGSTVLTQSPDGLLRAEISDPGAQLTALLAIPEAPVRIAAAGKKLLASPDGRDWQPLEAGLPEDAVVEALALPFDFTRQRLVYALTTAGELWERSI